MLRDRVDNVTKGMKKNNANDRGAQHCIYGKKQGRKWDGNDRKALSQSGKRLGNLCGAGVSARL